MRRPVAGLFVVGAAMALAAAACGDDAPSVDSPLLLSVDGADLAIPAGALPNGVTPDDVQILPVTEASEQVTVNGEEAQFAAFRLEPHGLQLEGPATLTVQVPLEDYAGAIGALHLGDETIELLGLLESDIDIESEVLSVAFELEHFSEVIIIRFPPRDVDAASIDFEPLAEDEVLIGDSFEATAVVHYELRPGEKVHEVRLTLSGERVDLLTTGEWEFQGQWSIQPSYVNIEPSILPASVQDAPSRRAVPFGQYLDTVAQQFTCARSLDWQAVGYWATVYYRVDDPTGAVEFLNPDTNVLVDVAYEFQRVYCVDPPDSTAVPTTTALEVDEAFAGAMRVGWRHFQLSSEIQWQMRVLGNDLEPVPDAEVTVKMDIGLRSAQEGEAMTAVTDSSGVASGEFTIYSYGAYTVSVENIEAEGLEYVSERNLVDYVSVTVTGAENPLEGPLLETVEEFIGVLAAGVRAGDVATLLARLHPAVIDLYGEDSCAAHVATLSDPSFDIEIDGIEGPGSWVLAVDGNSVEILDTYTVRAFVTDQGETSPLEMHFARADDGTVRWFSDCGDPLS